MSVGRPFPIGAVVRHRNAAGILKARIFEVVRYDASGLWVYEVFLDLPQSMRDAAVYRTDGSRAGLNSPTGDDLVVSELNDRLQALRPKPT